MSKIMSTSPVTICQQAADAIKAAKHRKAWGLFACRRFCTNRNVHPALYRLASQLEAASKAGF